MPKLAELDRCTGCTACAAVCPKGSIRMMPDADGFCHPVIDESTCIGCGLQRLTVFLLLHSLTRLHSKCV